MTDSLAEGPHVHAGAPRSIAAETFTNATTGDHSPIDARQIHLEPGSVPAPGQVEISQPIRRLPSPRTEALLGRDEALRKLDRTLTDTAEQVAVSQVVSGMGGIGKSELVRHYARTHQHRYPVAWWITADRPDNLEQALAALGAEIHPPLGLIGETRQAAQWALGWLRAHPGWLIVLDNVDDPAQVRPWLDDLSEGHVVITTRRNVYWPGAETVDLDVLDPLPSVELIARISRYTAAEHGRTLAAIAEELGYLPLALEQAAAYLRESPMTSPQAYLEDLRCHPLRLYSETNESGLAEQTIARLWDTHLSALQERDSAQQMHSEHLLRTLACYAPDTIPATVIGGGSEEWAMRQALKVLVSYNMVTCSGAGESLSVSMHRVFQTVVRHGLGDDDPWQQAARQTALTWLNHTVPDDPTSNAGGWPTWHALLPHIDALASCYLPGGEPEELGQLLTHAALFTAAQGQHHRSRDLAARALAITEAAYGPEHPEVAIALGNLAGSFRELGRVGESVPLCERALAIAETAYGPDHPKVTIALGNLASSFRELGRVGESVPLCERALAIAEAAYGPDHPDVAIRLGNLAGSFYMLGRVGESVPLFERALAITEAAYGPDHPQVATWLGNLAGSFYMLGRVGESVPLFERALAITEAAYGLDHPKLANLRHALSSIMEAPCQCESGKRFKRCHGASSA